MIIAAAGAGIAYLTGEAAEETVERLPGVSESMIEQHEDFAVYALIGLLVVGVASVVGLILIRSRSALIRPVAVATLLLAIISFGLVARTGYLGGQVRHSEVRSSAQKAGNNTNGASNAAEHKEVD